MYRFIEYSILLWWRNTARNRVCVLSVYDGEIEVVGFSTIPHVLKAKFGLSKGVVIAKGKSVHWRLSEPCPIEADGEPWMQETSEGFVTLHDQIMMLVDSIESIQQTCT